MAGRGGPCVVQETVFAAGFDDKYIVAENHPSRDRSRTAYWYIIRNAQSESDPMGILRARVMGPFPETQYRKLEARLNLPNFSIVYDDLK